MKYQDLHERKGVAGLNILLAVVVMLFMVGLIVMVFVMTGAELEEAITDADAIQVINDTGNSLSGVTDWFSIIIVLTAVVVLVLLVVLIITNIRASGMMGRGA